MSYSLNEVEALTKKATRSVGHPWGIAEESAKSVRWLCENGIDGCAVLTTYLKEVKTNPADEQSFESSDIVFHSPSITGNTWAAPNGRLCPLLSGTAVSDRAHVFTGTCVTLRRVIAPYLLLYFCTLLARQHCSSNHPMHIVTVQWQGFQYTTDGIIMSTAGTLDNYADEVCIKPGVIKAGGIIQTPQAQYDRATPTTYDWKTLNTFASRTYAPATEESRLNGAGAGLSDND